MSLERTMKRNRRYGRVSLMRPEEIEVPHDPGNFFSFRPISRRQRSKAETLAAAEYQLDREEAGLLDREAGGTGFAESDEDPDVQMDRIHKMLEARKRQDPLANLSISVLLKYGVVAWRGPSYVDPDSSDQIPCDDEGKDDLDDETARWAALIVAEMSGLTEGEAPSSAAGTEPSANGRTGSDRDGESGDGATAEPAAAGAPAETANTAAAAVAPSGSDRKDGNRATGPDVSLKTQTAKGTGAATSSQRPSGSND